MINTPIDTFSASAQTGSTMNRQRLLIVDDQPLNIQTLYELFSANYQIFMATSGEQALSLCQSKLPDLIILDVEMPDMDGYEVCRRLKADVHTSNIPVIFITGHHNEAEETKGLDTGAVDFISKPINPRIVHARVKNQLMLKAQSDMLRDWVYIDGLTGVKNRRYFDERLNAEWGRAIRHNSELSIIIIDVDFFKLYNDCYGHLMGDDCLRLVANKLNSCINRSVDLMARYGGEEFVCLLPDTNLAGAMTVAEQLRQEVISLQIPHAVSKAAPFLTISLGVCTKQSMMVDSATSILTQADAELYLAKNQGRNHVCGKVMS
ncbi:diguanylate cyclase [Solimicrobium silvestre]|uniref:diguanylate cyclase n=1 Tax=Solimicrobium silvestre TaxID=2099400 RepID=A0A2S9GZJ3_9BURK|nr:diguanylate cyclase [Solimicrobium silvestre]PRC93127.1 GGDEF: diguanylate cyclase (GGDEF) domain [Solimicrobium silvestre]